MARLPGAHGKQQFGIGPFVPAGIITPTQTPPNWGTAEGENVARLERVVYDQTSTPVFVAPAVAAAQTLVDVASGIARTLARSLAVFAATSAMAEPVFVQGPLISSKLASAYSETTVVTSRLVYSPTAIPPFQPPTVTPTAFAYQPADALWLRQRKDLPDGYVEALRPPTGATPIAPSDLVLRPRRITLPDGLAGVVAPLAAAAGITSTLASAYGSTTVILSRVVYDQSAARPAFPPVVTPTSVLPLANGLTVIRTVCTVFDQTSTPGFPPAASGTPVELRFVPDAPQLGFYRQRIKPIQQSAFVFAYPPDGTPTSVLPLANSLTIVRTAVTVLDQTSTPGFPPAPVPGAGVELRFVPDAPQNWFQRPKARLVPQSAFVFAYPPPPTATPAILFDVILPVGVIPPNRTAIRIDLQGAIWPPQDPLSLTGVPPVVVEPPPIVTPPGGAGVRVGRYKQLKLKKKLKRDECEELLAYLRSLPPAELQVELEELASQPQIASLLALMPAAAPPPVPGPADDDDDDECIALLLEILSS